MIREEAKRDAEAAHRLGKKYREGGPSSFTQEDWNDLDPTHTGYNEDDLVFEGTVEELEEIIFRRYCENWSVSI